MFFLVCLPLNIFIQVQAHILGKNQTILFWFMHYALEAEEEEAVENAVCLRPAETEERAEQVGLWFMDGFLNTKCNLL